MGHNKAFRLANAGLFEKSFMVKLQRADFKKLESVHFLM